MIKIKRVRLHNYCQHHNLDYVFGGGVNIVLGPNGCGKSNMLDSIRFALTGQTGLKGGRESLLRAGTEEGYCELTFDLDGQDMLIKRNLHSASAELHYGGSVTRGARKVDAEIARLVGVPLGVLSRFILVEQDQLQACLFDPPATRYEQLRQLLGMDQYDILSKRLSAEISEGQDLEQATQRLAEMRTLASEQARTLRKIHSQYFPVRRQVLGLEDLYAKAKSNKQTRTLMTELTDRHRAADHKVQALQPKRDELKAAVDALAGQVDDSVMVQLASGIKSLQRLLIQGQQAQGLEAQQKSLEAEQAPLATAIEQAEQYVSKIKDDLSGSDLARVVVKYFPPPNNGVIHCPVCDGAMTQADVSAWIAKAGEAEQMVAGLKMMENELAKLKARQQQVLGGLQMVRQRLVDAKPADVNATDQALREAQAMYDQLSGIRDQLNRATNELDMLDRMLAEYKEDRDVAARRLASLEGTIQPLDSDEDALIRQVEAMRASVARSAGMLEMARRSFKQAMQVYRQARHGQRNFVPQMAWNHMCKAAVEVVGKTLPRRVMDWYLVRIIEHTNIFLSRFNVPFTASYDEYAHDTIVHFPEGDWPVSRLSGGQRTVLALAFRMAIAVQLSGRVGIISFDEPDLWLDDSNIEAMREFFLNLTQMDLGYQLLIISHRMATFDGHPNVIRLG